MLSQWQNPLTAEQRLAMRTYAERAYPKETCGFILIDGTVVECQNTSAEPDTFVISAQDTADYLDDAKACWHSHAKYSGFSPADIKACKALNLPYAVWNCAGSEAFEAVLHDIHMQAVKSIRGSERHAPAFSDMSTEMCISGAPH